MKDLLSNFVEDESLSLSIAAASNQIAAPHKYIKDPWSKETLQVLLSSLIDKVGNVVILLLKAGRFLLN